MQKSTRRFLFLLLWLATYLPNLKLLEIDPGNKAIPLSVFYLVALLFAPMLLLNIRKLRFPPWYITGLYVLVIVYSCVVIPKYGFPRGLPHWVYGAYLLMVILNCGYDFEKKDWLDIAQIALVCFAVASLVFTFIVQRQAVYEILTRQRNIARITSLTRGGRNLDATWLALGCFLCSNRKIRWGCLAYTAVYAALLMSRVGCIAVCACLVWTLFIDQKRDWKRISTYALLAGVGIVCVAGLLYLAKVRAVDTLKEQVSVATALTNSTAILNGRQAMWVNILPMLKANPFGYGACNAMSVMKQSYGFTSYENNIHNVFFELLLGAGVAGGLWFLALAFGFIKTEIKTLFRDPLAAFLLVYLVLSLVQFHGGEALMLMVLGAYLQQRRLTKEKALVPEASAA